MMKQEIEAAVNFLTRLVAKSVDPGGSKSATATASASSKASEAGNNSSSNNNDNNGKNHQKHATTKLSEEKIQEFSRRLIQVLQNRFRNHWYPERPSRGQAYRCVRINENCSVDTSIAKACHDCGISYASLQLPVELTLWIDPNEVTCRFGEHKGSYCIVAKLSDGRAENYVNTINIEELEQKSIELSKQSSFEIAHSRKKRQHQAMLHQRTKNNGMTIFNNSNNNSNQSYHSHHAAMNGTLANGGSPNASHLANSAGHPHVPVSSTTPNQMNGYLDFTPNGLLPATSNSVVSLPHQQQQQQSQQFHVHFGGNQQPHFYNSAPSPFQQQQQHHVVPQQHSTQHYGSPTSHLFSKYNLGLQQSPQQASSSPGGPLVAGGRALNAASLSTASGTFRNTLGSANSNSVASKQQQVSVFQSSPNSHHNVSASTVIASLGASHHNNTSNGGSGVGSKPSSSSIAASNAASSFAREYTSMDKDRRHLTTAASASATAIVTNRF